MVYNYSHYIKYITYSLIIHRNKAKINPKSQDISSLSQIKNTSSSLQSKTNSSELKNESNSPQIQRPNSPQFKYTTNSNKDDVRASSSREIKLERKKEKSKSPVQVSLGGRVRGMYLSFN